MAVFESLFARVRTGVRIATASFGVLGRRKWLLAFPLLYGLAWTIGLLGLVGGILVAVFGGAYGVAAVESVAGVSGDAEIVLTVVGVVASVLVMAVATAVGTFFSAALVSAVGKLFDDEPTGIRDGLAGAWEARRAILVWGVVGGVVGLFFRALENQENQVGRMVRGILGVAWFAMTFFIVPVIVFEGGGVRESMRRSVELFRGTWGEVGGISLGVGFVTLLAAIPVAAAGIAAPLLFLENPGSVLRYTIVPTVLLLGAIAIVHTAATAIAKTALYRYATDGELPPEFEGIDPDDLARSRRGSTAAMGGRSGDRPGQI